MAFSSSHYDWQTPTSFGQGPVEADDSFSSLKSYLESVGDQSQTSMDPSSLARNQGGGGSGGRSDESTESSSASPYLGPAQSGRDDNLLTHPKRKGASEANKDVEALKDRRSGNRESAVHHTHGASAEPASAAASKKETKKRGGAGANTSEKRKEQNRNAQRAFRERRERYAKELEDKLQAMTEVADARQAENNSLKELIAQLQSENARSTSGPVTEPIPALANSSFTFNVNPAASSSEDSQDGNSPPTPPSNGGVSAGVASSANLAFDSLFSQAPPEISAPKHNPTFATPSPQNYESFADPMLGSFNLQNFTSQPSVTSSSGPHSGSMSASSAFSPFSNLPPVTSPSDLFSGASDLNSYGNFEDLLNGNTYGGSGLQPFESQSPAATFDAPTPSSDLFANYREPSSSSLFGEPLKSNVVSPPPALSGTAPEEPKQPSLQQAVSGNRQSSSSSAASTRSASTFNGSSGTPGAESSYTSSPASLNPDKPSPASIASSKSHYNSNGTSQEPCPIRDQFNSLRGAEAFDVDALCQDMTKKATCKESMRQALDNAVQQDLDVYAVFQKIGAEKSTRDAYLR